MYTSAYKMLLAPNEQELLFIMDRFIATLNFALLKL